MLSMTQLDGLDQKFANVRVLLKTLNAKTYLNVQLFLANSAVLGFQDFNLQPWDEHFKLVYCLSTCAVLLVFCLKIKRKPNPL